MCSTAFIQPRRIVCDGCYLRASYGVNRFLVSYHPLLNKLYPEAIRSASIYGRLVSDTVIINVNVDFQHNEEVSGRCAHVSQIVLRCVVSLALP